MPIVKIPLYIVWTANTVFVHIAGQIRVKNSKNKNRNLKFNLNISLIFSELNVRQSLLPASIHTTSLYMDVKTTNSTINKDEVLVNTESEANNAEIINLPVFFLSFRYK